MLNDSIVNFYLNYSFNQHVNDSLNRCGIRPEEAVQVLNGEFSGEEEHKEAIGRCLNSVLLKYYIFSSFFYPQLIALRKLGNEKAKKKVLKWAEDGHILEREFVFFPIFEQYVCPLALLPGIVVLPQHFEEVRHREADHQRSQFQNGKAREDVIRWETGN